MPPANTPADTPSLSPHRRSERLPGIAEFDAAARRISSPRHRLLFAQDSARETRGGIPELQHRIHRTHDHGSTLDGRARRASAGRIRRSSRDASDTRQPRDQAYGARIPLLRPGQRQSVYDWAPVSAPTPPAANDEVPGSRSLPPLYTNINDLLEPEPGNNLYDPSEFEAMRRPREFRETSEPRISQHEDLYGGSLGSTPGGSARRMAVIQALRRLGTRQRSLRPYGEAPRGIERDHILERIARPRLEWGEQDIAARARMRYRTAAHGNLYLPEASKAVEEVIDYLSEIRTCRTSEESIRVADRKGLHDAHACIVPVDGRSRYGDFVLDTLFLRASETSWLKAGGVFWGSQISPTSSSSPGPSVSFAASLDHNYAPVSLLDGGSPSITPVSANKNQWSVKVGISSVDFSQLRLTGTMEAFTDGKTNSGGLTSIVTFLEGEIIDFNQHTFKTLNFSSNLNDDANYWRKLDPFMHMTNAELVTNLLSKRYLKELTDNWIFMRWKEKCFISPDPEGGGLTIGGFYFLSLRREDGRIMGYYYDPQSQPYQELTLMPNKRHFPTYQFR